MPVRRCRDVDGGWGWMVVLASFFSHLLADGCIVSVGVVYTHLLEYFGESKSQTALVGSLLIGSSLVFGTVAGMLVDRFGCRPIAIVGGLMASVGFITSSFVTSLKVLCFTYGLVVGIGISMVFVPGLVSVSLYFDKKRSRAIGIALCGTGVGTLVCPPVCELMIQEYGWQGMMLLMGAIVLHFVACGMLYRPHTSSDKTDAFDSCDKTCPKKYTNRIPAQGRPSVHLVEIPFCPEGSPRSLTAVARRPAALLVYSSSRGDNPYNSTPSLAIKPTENRVTSNTVFRDVGETVQSCPDLRLSLKEDGVTENRSAAIKKGIKNVLCDPFNRVYEAVLATGTALWLTLFFIHNFVLFFWLDVPYVFLVDRAVELGIESTTASFLLSVVGVFDTIGQLMYGFLGDKRCISNTVLYTVSLMTTGVLVAAMPFCKTFIPMVCLAGAFGLFVSANFTLCTILLIEQLGQETIAVTCGVIMMVQGVGNSVGPPVAGKMYDILGRYDDAFYAAGAFILLSALLMFIPCTVKRLPKHAVKGDLSGQEDSSDSKRQRISLLKM